MNTRKFLRRAGAQPRKGQKMKLPKFDNYERYLLALPVPSLELPALPDNSTDDVFAARAEKVGYGTLAPWGRITELYRLLGVIPSSPTENTQLVS
jgi:hypothetical protein